MPPVATIRESSTFSFSGQVGIVGWGVMTSEDLILTQLLSCDACSRSCLGRIRTRARCCVNPHLISGEGLTFKNCGVETHRSRKWTPISRGSALITGRGDSIIINTVLLRAKLSSDIVAILKCTKRKESGMRTFLQITAP